MFVVRCRTALRNFALDIYGAVQHKRFTGTEGPAIERGGSRKRRRRETMVEQFETMQKFSRISVERVLTTQATASKAFAAIATETAAYAKKSFAEGKAALEQLSTVKAWDKALEIQTGYLKSAHEGFVAQTRKVAELYAGFAKDAFKPFAA